MKKENELSLFDIHQQVEESLSSYLNCFKQKLDTIEYIDQDSIIMCFVDGLRPGNLKKAFMLRKPTSLLDMFSIAQRAVWAEITVNCISESMELDGEEPSTEIVMEIAPSDTLMPYVPTKIKHRKLVAVESLDAKDQPKSRLWKKWRIQSLILLTMSRRLNLKGKSPKKSEIRSSSY